MDSSEDPFGAELGAFDLVADSTAAVARQQRIDRARQAARTYQAKVEEPRWFTSSLDDAQPNAKDYARLTLFAMHDLYYERRYLEVVDAGCALIQGEVKEQSEVIDLVLRAALKCDSAVQRRPDVLALARRWQEYPHLPSLSLSCARILFASCPASASSTLPPGAFSHAAPVPLAEVLCASLASLRIHPSLPVPRSHLAAFLRRDYELLSKVVLDPSQVEPHRAELERLVAQVPLSDAGAAPADPAASSTPPEEETEARRHLLRRVVGLLDSEADAAADSRDAGRNVRSL